MRPEALALGIASRQHGVITRRQAIDAGMAPSMIDRLVRSDRWIRYEPGTYIVAGTTSTWEQRTMASVCSVGPRAAASHRAAAALLRILPERPERIDVTAPHGTHDGSWSRFVVHRARSLGPRDVRVVDGITVTCPARTLVDLSGVMRRRQLAAALDSSLIRKLATIASLRAYIDRRRLSCNRGVGRLLRLLDDRESGVPESELERALLGLIERYGLPAPVRQASAGPYRVDFSYPGARVLIEVDGRATHGTQEAFEADRTRQNALALAGWATILRFTWLQVTQDPGYVASTIATALRWAG